MNLPNPYHDDLNNEPGGDPEAGEPLLAAQGDRRERERISHRPYIPVWPPRGPPRGPRLRADAEPYQPHPPEEAQGPPLGAVAEMRGEFCLDVMLIYFTILFFRRDSCPPQTRAACCPCTACSCCSACPC